MLSRTSSFVMATPVSPLILAECLSTTISSHPHLLGLPVVAPYSPPFSLISSPRAPFISVGKGPLPTLVVYAFTIPRTFEIFVGPTPRPVHAPPAIAFEDVT